MGLFNNNNNNNNKEKKTVWYQGVIDKEKENIKKVFYFEDYNIENGSVFILTNDDKIIYGEKNKEGKTYKTFIISDIIKVDTFVKSKVIHQNQWWNIMNFTMEDIEKVEYIELKIITLDEIFRFRIKGYINKKEKFDQLEILTAYIERKIK